MPRCFASLVGSAGSLVLAAILVLLVCVAPSFAGSDPVARGLAAKAASNPPRQWGIRSALMGDSITGYNTYSNVSCPTVGGNNCYNPASTEIDNGQTGYFTAFQQLAGHPFFFDPSLNKGIGGNTTTQMLARYATDIAANYSSFDTLFLLGGANDYGASISKETTFANLKSMATQALAAGKSVVIVTIMPRTGWGAFTGTQKTQGTKNNLWVNQSLKSWAAQLGRSVPLIIVDPWRDLSDPANTATTAGGSYTINAKAFADGLHPSGYGAYLVGKRISDTVASFVTPFPWRGLGAVDAFDATDNPAGNALANSVFLTTTGGTNTASSVTAAGGVPANWTISQTLTGAGTIVASEVTYSTVSAGSIGYDPTLGNAAQFVANITSGKGSIVKINLQSANITTSGFWTPGDKVYAVVRVKATGLAGFAGVGGAVVYTPDGGTTKYVRADGTPNNGFSWGQDDQTLTLVSPVLTIPSDTQTSAFGYFSMTVYMDATGASAATGTFQITDVQIRKLP